MKKIKLKYKLAWIYLITGVLPVIVLFCFSIFSDAENIDGEGYKDYPVLSVSGNRRNG